MNKATSLNPNLLNASSSNWTASTGSLGDFIWLRLVMFARAMFGKKGVLGLVIYEMFLYWKHRLFQSRGGHLVSFL